MKHPYKIALLVLFIALTFNAKGQSGLMSEPAANRRKTLVKELPADLERARAVRLANEHGLTIRKIDASGTIREIRRVDPLGHAQYIKTFNLDAAHTISTDKLWNGAIGGMHLKGENIVVGIWDGGMVRTTHVEFGSRAKLIEDTYDVVGHATHVAGTIAATGLDSAATGMAGLANIESYDWDNVMEELRIAAGDGMLIANHSWGYIQGFDYNSDDQRWEWYGNPDIDEKEDYQFGFYSEDAREWDDIIHDYPYLTIVKSAGNDRGESPGPGEVYYIQENLGWKVSNVERDPDGGEDGFDCLGSLATAKNILTVGAVEDIPDGYSEPGDVNITYFSDFGPTDDGRIKPDIMGNGTGLYSTYSNSNEDYKRLSGTSMSSPNVAGSLALLQELNFRLTGKYLRSSTLKGVVLHSADDAEEPGPDYKSGWGLMNTLSAGVLISKKESCIIEDSLTNKAVKRYRLFASGDSAIRVTLCWTDPMGPTLIASLNPTTQILVNDLDLRLVEMKDSLVHMPWVLDPQDPAKAAGTGDNFRDNVEQIVLPAPARGFYDLVVSHKGSSLTDNGQFFSLVLEGAEEVYVAPDSTTLNKNNGFLQVTDAPEYPLNQVFSWKIAPENGQPVAFDFKDFQTEVNDSVIIFDGPGPGAPVLAAFSGSLLNPDTLIQSTGSTLFIRFRSGNQEGFAGFSAKYCTTAPEEKVKILGTTYPCIASQATYLFAGVPESEYQWSFSGNVDSVQYMTVGVSVVVPGTPFDLTVTPENSCGVGNPNTRTLFPRDTPPVIDNEITGDMAPCPDTPTLISVAVDSSASYKWTLPQGWRGSSDSASIWVTPENGAGIVSVLPSNSCGASEVIRDTIVPSEWPDPPAILTDNLNPCENSTQEFYFLNNNGDGYQWSVDPGWEIIGTDTLAQVLIKVGSGVTGRVYLSATNKCGTTTDNRRYFLTAQPVPPVLRLQPSFIEGLDEVVLQNYSFYDEVEWLRNGEVIPDFHEQYLIVHRNGDYTVRVTNSEGCEIMAGENEIITVNRSALQFNISTGFGGLIKVENDTEKEASIRGFDLTGRVVFSATLEPGTNQYRTSHRGILIMKIHNEINSKTQKILLY